MRPVDINRSQTYLTREDFIPLKAKQEIRNFAESGSPKNLSFIVAREVMTTGMFLYLQSKIHQKIKENIETLVKKVLTEEIFAMG